MARRTRRAVSWDEWTAGRDGSILFCVQHLRLAHFTQRGKVPIYKTERWAEAHAERFGHLMEPVELAPEYVRRWAGE